MCKQKKSANCNKLYIFVMIEDVPKKASPQNFFWNFGSLRLPPPVTFLKSSLNAWQIGPSNISKQNPLANNYLLILGISSLDCILSVSGFLPRIAIYRVIVSFYSSVLK